MGIRVPKKWGVDFIAQPLRERRRPRDLMQLLLFLLILPHPFPELPQELHVALGYEIKEGKEDNHMGPDEVAAAPFLRPLPGL